MRKFLQDVWDSIRGVGPTSHREPFFSISAPPELRLTFGFELPARGDERSEVDLGFSDGVRVKKAMLDGWRAVTLSPRYCDELVKQLEARGCREVYVENASNRVLDRISDACARRQVDCYVTVARFDGRA